jgi:hypothetical protein
VDTNKIDLDLVVDFRILTTKAKLEIITQLCQTSCEISGEEMGKGSTKGGR